MKEWKKKTEETNHTQKSFATRKSDIQAINHLPKETTHKTFKQFYIEPK